MTYTTHEVTTPKSLRLIAAGWEPLATVSMLVVDGTYYVVMCDVYSVEYSVDAVDGQDMVEAATYYATRGHTDQRCVRRSDIDDNEPDPDAAYERHLETNYEYRAEVDEDLRRCGEPGL